MNDGLMRVRAKEQVLVAHRWDNDTVRLLAWLDSVGLPEAIVGVDWRQRQLRVPSGAVVNEGDYLIARADGALWACSAEDFYGHYEAVGA